MKQKITTLAFGIGIALLLMSVIWFFALYETANPAIYKPDISQPAQNTTQGSMIDYAYEFKMPSVYFHKSDNQAVYATINVGGIITAIIGGSVSVILSRLLNRYWPDKRKHHLR